jgi:hypothetical protein
MGSAAGCGTGSTNRATPMVNSPEDRYLNARRQLRAAADQLSNLDQQAAASGAPVNRRNTLTAANDPAAAAKELLQQDWPDRVELSDIVTTWLDAYQQTAHLWAELPPATQMRLAQPPEQ